MATTLKKQETQDEYLEAIDSEAFGYFLAAVEKQVNKLRARIFNLSDKDSLVANIATISTLKAVICDMYGEAGMDTPEQVKAIFS